MSDPWISLCKSVRHEGKLVRISLIFVLSCWYFNYRVMRWLRVGSSRTDIHRRQPGVHNSSLWLM